MSTMPRLHRFLLSLAATLALIAGASAAIAEPLFTLGDGGRTFFYRARPGDTPGTIAEMFGVPPEAIPRFLADNGIVDPKRISPGFVFRTPNPAVESLTARNATLEVENARLGRALADAAGQVRSLTRDARQAREGAALAETQAANSARLETLWPAARTALIVLLLCTAGAIAVAVAAVRRQRQAGRYARALAVELEEKRRVSLAERQESARRVLDLEARVRTLESRLGPRVVVGGRGS
jgi:hypothetical protein